MGLTLFRFLGSFLILLLPLNLAAETITGVVRTVNYGSHSFGLDQPPLVRVYINAGTKFKTSGGENNFRGLKVGDKVEVSAKSLKTNTYIAAKVRVTGHLDEKKDLASDAIQIKLNQRFLMGVSQTAVLEEAGKKPLKLRSTEFINTLCKDGYDCSGEGEVGMRLEVKKGGDKNEIILTSKNHRKPTKPVKVEVLGYEIQLVESGEDVVLLVVRHST